MPVSEDFQELKYDQYRLLQRYRKRKYNSGVYFKGID